MSPHVWQVVVELADLDGRGGARGRYVGHALVAVTSDDMERAGQVALEAACRAFEATYAMDARPAWIRSRTRREADRYGPPEPFDAVLRLELRARDYRTRIEAPPGTRRHIA